MGTTNLLLSSLCTSAKGMVGSCPSLGLIQDSCSEGQAGKHIILGQQSCGNSVCGFHQVHSGFSFTAPRSPPNTAGITPQKYLRYTSACFPVSPPKQPPVKCVIVSFSMKEKLFLSLTGSQLLQTTRAISLKPRGMSHLTPLPLLLRHLEDPTPPCI